MPVVPMSPLEFQKKLHLHEARRPMLAEQLDVSTAGFRVGYESPSQFGREYLRMHGAPCIADCAMILAIQAIKTLTLH